MDYISEANKFMYDDNYITETKFEVHGKVYASKQAAEENFKSKGYNASALNTLLNSGKFVKSEKSSNKKAKIGPIKNKSNSESSFNVERHHTEEDIHDAYNKGHRSFKIKRDDPKFDEKYSHAHTKLYNNDHRISTTHHKDKSVTVHAN